MGKHLVIISASDMTGYTYTEQYAVSEINDYTIDALKVEFEQGCGDAVYMGRGTIIKIDLDILHSQFTARDDNKVLEYIDRKEKDNDEERTEYERLKAKFEGC